VEGRSSKARSGSVRRGAAEGLRVSTLFPIVGATTAVPPLPSHTLRWGESGGAPVGERTVVEQMASPTGERSCSGAAWRVTRVLDAAGPSLGLEHLEDGRCYRYVIAVADEIGRGATAVSGPLLVTRDPPPCAYGGVVLDVAAIEDWARTPLDTTLRLPRRYVPPDLVATSGIRRLNEGLRIRALAYDDLAALAAAARRAGTPIDITSAYRSYGLQARTSAAYLASLGPLDGLLRAARPGHSEHQLGLAIDVKAYRGPSPASVADWGATPAGAWMRANAWRYGWVMSYPKDESPAVTCYRYEPWHFRYVGREVARAVHESGLSLRQYLWLEGKLAPDW
jgi:D-alanyl-D-alanine carboxypeptidase